MKEKAEQLHWYTRPEGPSWINLFEINPDFQTKPDLVI